MTEKKELRTAYIIAMVLFFVGVASYAGFSGPQPESPARLMFKSVAGNVLFDHKAHLDDSGYAIACLECHHHPAEEENLASCGSCHAKDKKETASLSCLDCHEADEVDAGETPARSDAFHDQCVGCHKDGGAGPEECGSCHVM
ncbi:conserved hypothetical protein [Candidatus Desulfarcum epimagneticum]|uniref:Class III cytochrome C domain-containing protein n=1 Tax=uncultured Desulfobacteraceae bacterium TaxID=218296 RepID=A0A484HLK5_9BACT|nr:conserved hypothetical protein [uncultured Desulfobacteraceae bacterium]